MKRCVGSLLLFVSFLLFCPSIGITQSQTSPQQQAPSFSDSIPSNQQASPPSFAPATTSSADPQTYDPVAPQQGEPDYVPPTTPPSGQFDSSMSAPPESKAESDISAGQIPPSGPGQQKNSTYSKEEINREVMGFFEGGSMGIAKAIAKVFQDLGEPVGYIKGNEAAGAAIIGFRYGEGELHLKNGQTAYLYWQSPTLGFDLGLNASKTFTLIYGMENINEIYQRYPAIDGSAYIIGGIGVNYQRNGDVTLVPIRFGAGLRLGANVGYQHFTKSRTINPF